MAFLFVKIRNFHVGVAVLILECNKSWRVKRCKSDGLIRKDTKRPMGFKHKTSKYLLANFDHSFKMSFQPIRFNLLIDQFCVLGDILPDPFCPKTTAENLVKEKNVKRFRGQLNQQSNRK